MPNFTALAVETYHEEEVFVAVTKRCITAVYVKLPAIKDTWRWRSRARKNHIGMYGMQTA